ncbi:hypothetical protein [Actinomadura sp. DC4]|uniref:hypothetical protein n=1 Tax=Actinomadura sp. DC4 TaxID=3055069 RepID=UPI0025AF5DBB|nr:hypothetical protein [Actinomadura sp. DC4]MDN3357148.1 hypothetical protein [Actinomadura sp. DC4]
MYRHKFDPSSLVAALVFLGVAIRYLVEGTGGHRVSYDWAMPSVLVSIGLIIVLRLVFRSRRRPR